MLIGAKKQSQLSNLSKIRWLWPMELKFHMTIWLLHQVLLWDLIWSRVLRRLLLMKIALLDQFTLSMAHTRLPYCAKISEVVALFSLFQLCRSSVVEVRKRSCICQKKLSARMESETIQRSCGTQLWEICSLTAWSSLMLSNQSLTARVLMSLTNHSSLLLIRTIELPLSRIWQVGKRKTLTSISCILHRLKLLMSLSVIRPWHMSLAG